MPVDLTGSTTFHPTITVPEAGDDRKAASIVPAFQDLLDNTTDLDARLGALDGADHTFTGEIAFYGAGDVLLGENVEVSYEVPKLRRVMLPLKPLSSIAAFDDPQWLHADSNLQWAGAGDSVHFVLVFGADFVPTGARIKAVRAAVNASVGVELNFTKFTYPTTGTAAGTAGTVYTDSVAAGALAEHLLEITCDELVHNDQNLFRVRLELNDPPPSCAIRWVHLEFTDPGPRSF
jgi:hypothetical protein